MQKRQPKQGRRSQENRAPEQMRGVARRLGLQILEYRLALAADGLDASFGDAGRIVTPLGNLSSVGAVIEQPDGKLVAAGGRALSTSPIAATSEIVLIRYNADGSFDTTFGDGGKSITPSTTVNSAADDLVLLPNGEYLVAGSGGNIAYYTGALAKYHADGSLDTSFGDGGIVAVHDATYDQVAVQSNGKILVAGSRLRRYNADGTLDTSFGTGGTVNLGGRDVRQMTLEPDGKILTSDTTGLKRYNTDGSLDPTFGTGGVLSSPHVAGSFFFALQADGTILWGGSTGSDPFSPFQLDRFNADGSLDGAVATITPTPGQSYLFYAIDVQPDGKIVLAGLAFYTNGSTSGFASLTDFLAIRLNADGSPDATFGLNGKTTTSFGANIPSIAFAETTQSDGQLVLAGSAGTGDAQNFALARFSNDFNQSYVDHLYLDLLGRRADPAGESYFNRALSQGRLTRSQVAAVLMASEEYRDHEVTGIYEQFLRRAPDAAGLDYWSHVLASSGNRNQVQAAILASDEYFTKQGNGTNAGFVTALYHDLFSRAPDPAGAASWMQLLDTGRSRTRVAAGMMASAEYVLDEVNAFYAELLNRAPDSNGQAYFQELLSAGAPPEQAIFQMAVSQEYYSGR